jgi:photosystem II stability/assembly factor-like uncharacterized protein
MRTTIVIATFALSLFSLVAAAQTTDEKRPHRWLSSLRMITEQTGWARSQDGSLVFGKRAYVSVVRTTDGSIHWRDVRPDPPGQRILSVNLAQALTAHIAWAQSGYSGNPVLFRTVDGGETWKSATLPDVTIQEQGLHFIDPLQGWFCVFSRSKPPYDRHPISVYRSTDGGAAWSKVGSIELSRYPLGTLPGITFLNTTTGWIAGFDDRDAPDGMYQLITRDGGATWRRQILPRPQGFTPSTAWLKGGVPNFFSERDGTLIINYTIGQQAGVLHYVTHDGGSSWTYTTPLAWEDTGLWPASSSADVDHVWVAHGATLHMTTDGGRRWTTLRPGPPFVNIMELYFISSKIGWATSEDSGVPTRLLKTVDGGRTWKDLSFSILH